MNKKYYIIPVFIPEKACPFRCVYCNQYRITNKKQPLNPSDADKIIRQYLNAFPESGTRRVAFFGGSFTGMAIKEQNQYLDVVQPYIHQGAIESVQLSTRPDYINEAILDNLSKKNVSIIELGAQSLDDAVLCGANRGHDAEAVRRAALLVRKYSFKLGLQMMIGLPGDSREKSLSTAEEIVALGADYTRIYPTLVIKDTGLEKLYLSGGYQPLALKEAVEWCKELMLFFEYHHVVILRIGLHSSEGLSDGTALLAGPYHPSFKELVASSVWRDILHAAFHEKTGDKLIISVNPKDINAAIGHRSENRKRLLKSFKAVQFLSDNSLECYKPNWKIS
jgi:histone acetyltransferase (RNA polymerase elongator complex component)